MLWLGKCCSLARRLEKMHLIDITPQAEVSFGVGAGRLYALPTAEH